MGLSTALPPGSVVVNELTTVAAVWTTFEFDSLPNNVGTPPTNAQGLVNALTGAKNLVNVSTGELSSFLPPAAKCSTSPPPANCLTERKLDALADVLAACVQSSGPSKAFPGKCSSVTSASAPCDQLLCYSYFEGEPSDTLEAAAFADLFATVVSPLNNKSLPLNLVNSNSPFQPIPSSTPNDLTLALQYPTTSPPNGVAVDAVGNVWAVSSGMFEFSPGGVLLSPSTGYTGGGLGPTSAANGVAIDDSGNVWVANGVGSVTELRSSGHPVSPSTGYTNASTKGCEGVAIDKSGKFVWVTNNSNNTVAELKSGGTFISPSDGYTGGGLDGPHEIALDASSNVWVANGPKANKLLGSITELKSSGKAFSGSPYTGGGLSGTHGIAIDPSGNVWAANRTNSSVSEFSSSGKLLSPATGLKGGGLNEPNDIETDSRGTVFVANQGTGTLTRFTSRGFALSPATGFQGSGGTSAHRLAIDLSGNVWVTNDDPAHPAVIEFFGLAAPVKTPLNGPPQLP